MAIVYRTDQLASVRDEPTTVGSSPERRLDDRFRRSTVSSICALIVFLLVEIAWIGLLFFLAREFVFG